jgi:hypothetical protein
MRLEDLIIKKSFLEEVLKCKVQNYKIFPIKYDEFGNARVEIHVIPITTVDGITTVFTVGDEENNKTN